MKTHNSKLFICFFFLPILILLHFAFLNSISAHILKTDGTVGAVIHIDPEDDPIAGQPSNIFWDFTNKGQTLNLSDCVCYVSILKNGQEIEKQQLVNDTFTFTFPERNVYQIQISGTPTSTNLFKPFVLSYDIRVEREVETPIDTQITKPNMISKQVLIGGIITVLGIIIIIPLRRKHKK